MDHGAGGSWQRLEVNTGRCRYGLSNVTVVSIFDDGKAEGIYDMSKLIAQRKLLYKLRRRVPPEDMKPNLPKLLFAGRLSIYFLWIATIRCKALSR